MSSQNAKFSHLKVLALAFQIAKPKLFSTTLSVEVGQFFIYINFHIKPTFWHLLPSDDDKSMKLLRTVLRDDSIL